MSTECNTCYTVSTNPQWVAEFVTKLRTDKPCERHQPTQEKRNPK